MATTQTILEWVSDHSHQKKITKEDVRRDDGGRERGRREEGRGCFRIFDVIVTPLAFDEVVFLFLCFLRFQPIHEVRLLDSNELPHSLVQVAHFLCCYDLI